MIQISIRASDELYAKIFEFANTQDVKLSLNQACLLLIKKGFKDQGIEVNTNGSV